MYSNIKHEGYKIIKLKKISIYEMEALNIVI